MPSMGSKCGAELCMLAARDTGDGARLANCGSGEKEKLGLNGRARPPALVLGGFKLLLFSGGV